MTRTSSQPIAAIVVALICLAGASEAAATRAACRRQCVAEGPSCRRATRAAARSAKAACAEAADARACRIAARTRLRGELAGCGAARAACLACCRASGSPHACGRSRLLVGSCTTNAECDDGTVCTDDLCDALLGCVYAAVPHPCDDGNACTAGDACSDSVCIGGDVAPGCGSCQAAAVVPPEGGTFTGTTAGSSTLSGTCAATDVAPERVFRWTAPRSGTATFATCAPGTGFDTVVYVRHGGCDLGAEVACNDDTTGCAVGDGTAGADHHGSTLQPAVVEGETYDVVVDGFQDGHGAFTLSIVPPSACGNGVREGPEACDGADAGACPSGTCTDVCRCAPPSGGLADLVPSIDDVHVEVGATVPAGDVAEGCAEATTGVDLLRFSTTTRNVGTADLVLGDPGCPDCVTHPLETCGNPEFLCSPAGGHNHPHFTSFASYQLLDAGGRLLATGRKQSFCIRDSVCGTPQFTCTNQGLTVGCSDVYSSTLGCQYLDVTHVPAGTYTLRVVVDPFGRLAELDDGNNTASVPVVIPERPGGPTTTSTTTATTTSTLATTTTTAPATTTTIAGTTTTSSSVPGTTVTSTSTSTTSSTTLAGGNHAPDCSHASASPGTLWPPNHKLVPVTVTGVRDADGDALDVRVIAVQQNEPVGGDDGDGGDGDLHRDGKGEDGDHDGEDGDHKGGDGDHDGGDGDGGDGDGGDAGDTCPDASGIGSPTVLLRAERNGGGDGRVYRLAFVADDGRGGRCEGLVTVCVPHDHGHGGCGEHRGPWVDSTATCHEAKRGPAPAMASTPTDPPSAEPALRPRKGRHRKARRVRRHHPAPARSTVHRG